MTAATAIATRPRPRAGVPVRRAAASHEVWRAVVRPGGGPPVRRKRRPPRDSR